MIEQKLMNKLKKVGLFVMDVDGTLTNGKVYYSKNGEELKIFSIRDGMGIELLRRGGIEIAIITSENSAIVSARAEKLKIKNVVLGSRNKKEDLRLLTKKLGYKRDNIAFIGDDVNDIQALEYAGVCGCPNDSTESVKKIADFISSKNGGDGAVREFAELILEAQGKMTVLPESW